VIFLPMLHDTCVHRRRVSVLCDHVTHLIPENANVLDVGCGDGSLSAAIMRKRPDVKIAGLDVLVRGQTHIPIEAFDGEMIPYDNRSVDVVMFVDVLHHTRDPMKLLSEATRVAGKAIVIKDHACEGVFDCVTLRLMDHVGNAHYGVALPYNFWSRRQWLEAFATLGLAVAVWKERLNLYPAGVRWIFDRSLHFITRVELKPLSRDSSSSVDHVL
jgi:SAM-dependent methyltransferase